MSKLYTDSPTMPEPWRGSPNKRVECNWKLQTWVTTKEGGKVKYHGYVERDVKVDLNVGTNKETTTATTSGASGYTWKKSDGTGQTKQEKDLRQALDSGRYMVRDNRTGRLKLKEDGDFKDFLPQQEE